MMIHVKIVDAKVWHQIDTRNSTTRNARNVSFVSFLSFLLAVAPGDPHAVPRREASNFGTIPVAIDRPASPNVATSGQNAECLRTASLISLIHHAF